MTITEKTKERLDDASKEIKAAIDSLGKEAAELTRKVKEKLKDSGEDLKETAEELSKEVRKLSERVKGIIPKREKKTKLPVRVKKISDIPLDGFERPLFGPRWPTNHPIDGFFREFGLPSIDWEGPFSRIPDGFGDQWPRVDMSETDDEIQITAELPGVDKDNLEISLSDGRVSIRGEKNEQEENKGKDYYRLERSYGSFRRTFPLPCEINTDKVDASFKDGVLKINLPKTEAARQRIRSIPVRSG